MSMADGRTGKTRSRTGRTYYHYSERASIPRSAIESIHKVAIPENVERRELSAPCSYCGVNASTPCKHRKVFFPESHPA